MKRFSGALLAACSRAIARPKRGRPLTSGEIAMARLVFADAIDYSRVAVHDRGYFPFGLQHRQTAVTPNGSMYFPKDCFEEDFSARGIGSQMWFMHELTHVWQFQLGYWVKMRGAIRVGLAYGYTLAPGRRLADYNMEAQGNIIADYFALRFRGSEGRRHLYEHRYRARPDALALYEAVLADFLDDPANRSHLPRGGAMRVA
ncbi:probable vgr related protein [Caballeronia glathei]|uniref:Rhs element Vgr protein n=2 Tax=Caballeronia glathei TaxID=60547 RepID=A0A069PJ74_9BURK|nr:Rhs element Vgr protein [Caballeronia glathei]KDR40758.1 Rhs element Vgr protein [Caballeronia glathei]CDY79737.1 probable vgr related protein [Caballeronia glathei]